MFQAVFILILMITAYSSWKSKIQYLKILENIYNTETSTWEEL